MKPHFQWLPFLCGLTLLMLLPGLAMGQEAKWIDDPSSRTMHPDFLPQVRVLADFNVDGIQDMAFFGAAKYLGNAGGIWKIYLQNEESKFLEIGEIFTNVRGFAIEKLPDFQMKNAPPPPASRIWVYHRIGGGRGSLGFHEVNKTTLSEFKGFEVFQPDYPMSEALGKAVFDNSDEDVTLQYYSDPAKGWETTFVRQSVTNRLKADKEALQKKDALP